jgi:hypothetical protein
MMDRETPDQPDDSAEDRDTGEPIAMLRDFGEEPTAGFLARIRGSIQRRMLTSQLAEISWFAPVMVLFEFVKFFFAFFESVSGRRLE